MAEFLRPGGIHALSYRQTAVRGFGWLTSLQIASAVTSQLATIALAALLTPLDFGLYGLALIAISLVAVPGDLGLSVELVRRRNFEELFPTALRLRWAIACVLFVTCVGASQIFAIMYGTPLLFPLILALAMIFPATALGFGPRVILTRSLNFKVIAAADLVGRFVGPLAAVLCAFIGWGYWSLAVGLVSSAWITALALTVMRPVHFPGRLDANLSKSLISAGKFISVSTLAGFFLSTLDNVGTATFFGLTSLGYYAFSYSLAITVPRSVSSMVETVTFPLFSRFPEDHERIWRGYCTTVRYVSYFAFPLAFGFVALAPSLIPMILGRKWQPISLLVQVLAIGGLAYSLAVPSSTVLLAIGRAKAVTLSYVVALVILAGSLALAVFSRLLVMVAVAATVSGLVYFLALLYHLRRSLPLRRSDLVHATAWPSLAAVLGLLVITILLGLISPNFLSLSIATLSGFAAYLLALEYLSRGEFWRSVKELVALVIG